MANEKFYTYIHKKSDSDEIFYVGKGQGSRCSSPYDRNKHWHHIVEKHGFNYEIVQRFSEESEAFAHEVKLIAGYRAEGLKLANHTSGGQGQSGRPLSPEHRAKISAALKGRPLSEKAQAASRAASKGAKRGPLSAEHRLKISIAKMGMRTRTGPMPLEARLRISATLKGRKRTPSPIVAGSAPATRRPLSEAHKASISATKKGAAIGPFSDEHRKNMSIARKTYFANKRLKAGSA